MGQILRNLILELCDLDNFYIYDVCAGSDIDCEKVLSVNLFNVLIHISFSQRSCPRKRGRYNARATSGCKQSLECELKKSTTLHKKSFPNFSVWEDIQSATCKDDPILIMKFQHVQKSGVVSPDDKYATGYRCVRKNIDKFYDNTACQSQICDQVSWLHNNNEKRNWII